MRASPRHSKIRRTSRTSCAYYPKFDRWNMLFADGHSSAVLIDKEPVQASDGPSSGPGWRFEWKTNQ